MVVLCSKVPKALAARCVRSRWRRAGELESPKKVSERLEVRGELADPAPPSAATASPSAAMATMTSSSSNAYTSWLLLLLLLLLLYPTASAAAITAITTASALLESIHHLAADLKVFPGLAAIFLER